MHRLYNWYNAVEACAKTWHLQIWYYPFCILTKLYIHIVCDYMSYRAIAYHIISFHTMILKESSTISILPSCAYDVCHNFHVPGWSDRKRLGRLGQLHSISFARIREWTRRAGARGFLGSRRLYRRRKRRGLQATSRHRDQAWSHFDVGHHGIHHPSGLDLLKLCFKSFKTISVKIIKVCFFVNGHFYNSTIVGWTYWQCVFFLNASRWNNPQEITGKFPGYLSPSAGLKFADVPNGLAAISKVPAAGQGWNKWIHLKIKAISRIFLTYIYIYITLFIRLFLTIYNYIQK